MSLQTVFQGFPKWRNPLAVDLIGPWKVQINQINLEFHALTCTDPVSSIVVERQSESKTRQVRRNMLLNNLETVDYQDILNQSNAFTTMEERIH